MHDGWMDSWFVKSRLNKVWMVSGDSWIEIKQFTAYLTFYMYIEMLIWALKFNRWVNSFTERLSWLFRPNRGFHSILKLSAKEYYVLRAFNVYVTSARAFRARECCLSVFSGFCVSHILLQTISFSAHFFWIFFSSSLISCLILLENARHQFNLRNHYL